MNLLARLSGPARAARAHVRPQGDAVVLETDATQHDFPPRDTGTPTYDGLPLADYVSVLEMLNPMHRLWSDGRWNKITLAHGCYWKKCSFCDVSLDYIGRYDRPSTDVVARPHSRADRRDRPDRLSSRRRGRAAGRHARAREAPARRAA